MDIKRVAEIVEIVTTLLCLALAAFIVLARPTTVYAPVPKVAFFLLVSVVPAVMFGSKAAAKFELSLPGMALSATGALAAVFTTFILLNRYASPEEKISAYRLVDPTSSLDLNLENADQIRVVGDDRTRGLNPSYCVNGDQVLTIFPEQLESATILLTHPGTGVRYQGTIQYAGSHTAQLKIGEDLKPVGVTQQ